MLSDITSLFSFRDLLLTWVYRTIRARYQQSVLGGLWAIIVPVAQTLIFSIIFTYFVPVNTGGIPYIVFSYTAMLPWTLFSASITDMVDSLVGNMNLVSKIYFPREILSISALLARLVDFLIGFILLIVLMIYYRMPITIYWILLPVIMLIQLCLSLGLGLAGAALNVFYRDVRHIFILVLQIWFYASPIIYPVSSVPSSLQPIYYLNPMAGVIEGYRSILLYQQLPNQYLLISMCAALIILPTGYWFFKRVEKQFADVI
jgi:lipopolysaccharide transport system permease protein